MLWKSLELSIKDFYCVFVRTEINLISFSDPSNCVNTQYTALSGAMGQAMQKLQVSLNVMPKVVSGSLILVRDKLTLDVLHAVNWG